MSPMIPAEMQHNLAKAILADTDCPVLVVTGAGISAESGVPTFRGEGETWRDRHFTELATPEAFAADPRMIWDWYLYRRGVVAAAKPNAAHLALANWAKRRGGVALVTQNVDDLHEQAGQTDIIRYHGSLWHNRCTACENEREDRSLAYPELPVSPCCGAPERPAIVWFGELLPPRSVRRASAAFEDAKVVLVVGTSGQVSTATLFASAAVARKIPVILVNLEEMFVSSHLFLQGKAGEILPTLLAV